MIASQRAEKNKALMRQTRRLFLLMEVPAAAQYLDAPQQETPSLLITDHPAHPHPAFGGLRLVLDFGELLRVGWRRSHPPRTMHWWTSMVAGSSRPPGWRLAWVFTDAVELGSAWTS